MSEVNRFNPVKEDPPKDTIWHRLECPECNRGTWTSDPQAETKVIHCKKCLPKEVAMKHVKKGTKRELDEPKAEESQVETPTPATDE